MSAIVTQRHRFLNRGASLAGLLGLILVLAVLGLSPGRKHTGLEDSLHSLGHFSFFALLAIAVAVALRRFDVPRLSHHGLQYFLGLAAAIVTGGMLEFGQKFVPFREPSWGDLVFDTVGGVAGISLLMAWDRRRSRTIWEVVCGLLAGVVFVIAVCFGIWPFANCKMDYWQRDESYPELLLFDQPWAARFLSYDDCVDVQIVARPDGWPSDSAQAVAGLLIRPEEPYPGFGIKEPYPDWSNDHSFVFDLLNPTSTPLDMGIRIQDFEHDEDYYDRFNRVLKIQPGFQTIRIPVAEIAAGPRHRRMDLAHVDRVKLFLIRPTESVRLFTSGFRLE